MAKKQVFFDEAERLYVIDQLTFNEIASRLSLSEKTIRNWKDEGGWEQKRLQYLKSKQAFHEELYEFARSLMRAIKSDIDAGERVDPGRMYAFTRLLPLITKVKDYEEAAGAKDQEEGKPASPDELLGLVQEVMGIES